ncbi:MAG: NAD-dependent epimerase/dehydratase family protein [Draconibacterium sp.]
MKVLVLGGTGAIGTHLVTILSNKGIETVVTSRRQRESKENINYVLGNAHDSSFLNILLTEKWDAIVDFMVYSTLEFNERVQSLLKSTHQYIFLSSSRIFASSSEPIKEDSPRLLNICKDNDYLRTDEYGLAKARQEDILKNSGLSNWTIIRPSVTFSENRLQLGELEKEHWLYRALSKRTVVLSRDIITKFTTLTYGLDVSKGISEIVGKEEALKETFNLTVSESHKWEEIISVYFNAIEFKTGTKPKTLILNKAPIPDRFVVKYDKLYDRQFDNSKITKYLDSNIFSPTLAELKRCIETFLDCPSFLNIDWKKEAFLDKLTGESTPLNEMKTIKQKVLYLLYRYVISYKLMYKMHQITSRHGK